MRIPLILPDAREIGSIQLRHLGLDPHGGDRVARVALLGHIQVLTGTTALRDRVYAPDEGRHGQRHAEGDGPEG